MAHQNASPDLRKLDGLEITPSESTEHPQVEFPLVDCEAGQLKSTKVYNDLYDRKHSSDPNVVRRDLIIHKSLEPDPEAHRCLPPWLRYWPEYKALVCTKCEDQPLLCLDTIRDHVASEHQEDAEEIDFEKIYDISGLAAFGGGIRIPEARDRFVKFLRAPVHGWHCSDCNYASNRQENVLEHETRVHSRDHTGETPAEGPQTLVQYASIIDERYYFSVDNVAFKQNKNGDTTNGNTGRPDTPVESSDGSSIFLDGLFQAGNRSEDEVSSVASRDSTTYRSLLDAKFKDRYTEEQRRDILRGLWQRCSGEDLEPLEDQECLEVCRELAVRSGEESIRAFRRFDVATTQALLWTQHKLTLLEEEMSQSKLSDTAMTELTEHLKNYVSLIKGFQDLAGMRQPSDKASRAIGRVLATAFHEPRYYYAVDALNLLDLDSVGLKETKEPPDGLRRFLQKHLPKRMLDKLGKDRREVDRLHADRVLPSGGMAEIIAAHRRHGPHISPAVDNIARIVFALIGGVFLLAPMVALAYSQRMLYLIIITVLFTLFVSVALGLVSRASNQELLAATAAYAAVLVVFVGNAVKF